MKDWGYESVMGDNMVQFDDISWPAHITVGVLIIISGVGGSSANLSLLVIHLRLKERLLDPTGIIIANFLLANLAMAILQFPFSGSSAIAGSWLYGDMGCQIYAAVGFCTGIGTIYAMGLIILDSFLITRKLTTTPRPKYQVWVMIAVSWHSTLLFTVPPLLDIFGRFGLEPGGTSCTIDYWHGNFRNYNNYVIFLVVLGYIIPVSTMLFLFLRTVSHIQTKEATATWSLLYTEHQAALTKTCGLLFITQIFCWTPYAILCLWTLAFPPETLNVYYTLIPSVCCKLAPVLNALLLWNNIPRIRAGAVYLQKGSSGSLPPELFDYTIEMQQEEIPMETNEAKESEPLNPDSC